MELFSGIGERAPQGPLGDKNKTRDIQGLKNKWKKLYGRMERIENWNRHMYRYLTYVED